MAFPPADVDLHGFIDEHDCTRVTGWAWDARNPDRSLEVEVRVHGRLLGIARADRFRADLAIQGERSGRQAFELVLSEPIPPECLADLEVTVRNEDFALPLSRPREPSSQLVARRWPLSKRLATRGRRALT